MRAQMDLANSTMALSSTAACLVLSCLQPCGSDWEFTPLCEEKGRHREHAEASAHTQSFLAGVSLLTMVFAALQIIINSDNNSSSCSTYSSSIHPMLHPHLPRCITNNCQGPRTWMPLALPHTPTTQAISRPLPRTLRARLNPTSSPSLLHLDKPSSQGPPTRSLAPLQLLSKTLLIASWSGTPMMSNKLGRGSSTDSSSSSTSTSSSSSSSSNIGCSSLVFMTGLVSNNSAHMT